MPDAGGAGGVRIGVAFDDPVLEPDPTWTFLTGTNSLVASYEIARTKSDEFQRYDGGEATVTIFDREGVLDPTNTAGPYYGKIQSLLQVRIELLNPVDDTWYTRARCWITDYDYDIRFVRRDEDDAPVGVTALTLNCRMIFELLTAIEMYPDVVSAAPAFGDPPPNGAEGQIFFDNATAHDRCTQVLTNAGIDPFWYVVFTSNVNMAESTYDPATSVLEVIQDAADAEFPTVGNVYEDRRGRMAWHGRLAKFDPVGVSAGAGDDAWDFRDWKCGDETACLASPSDTAQVRQLHPITGREFIYNYALCTAQSTLDEQVPDQVSRDDVSIAAKGFRAWSAENLKIDSGILTGNTADDECALFASYITSNYATERLRLREIGLRSIRPEDPRGPATWAFLTQADISDRVAVTVGFPGGGGLNAEPFFIEGITESATPLNPDYANVTMTLDTSPQAWFTGGAWSGES